MLPNRSAGDVGCEIFSYLYQFATVCLDTMRWQLRLGRMGIKVEGAGKSLLFAIGLVRPIHNRAMTVCFGKALNFIYPFFTQSRIPIKSD